MADLKDLAKDTVRGLGKALEIAARPSRAGAGALGAPKGRALEYALKNLKGERSDDFAWTLRRHGLMKEGIPNAVAGFALDVALDPLGPVAKVLNAGSKAATGANLYNLGRETVLEGLRGSKFGRNVLLDTFSRTERLADPEFRRLYRLYESEMSHSAQGAAEKLREAFKGLKSLRGTDDVARAKRQALHRALEEGPTPDFDPEMLTALGRLKNWRKELADAEVAAGVMDPERLLPNYTPYIFRGTDDASDVTARVVSAVNAQNKHALERRLENYDAFLKAGEGQGAEPITDVAEAMLSRALRARKAEASGRLLQRVAANPEWTIMGKPSDAYRTLIPGRYGEMPVGQLFTNKVIRKDVADELNKLIAAPPVKDSDLMRAYNYWVNTPFKATATVARPGFALTNLKGNIWNAAIGGANPLDVGAHGVAGWLRSITGGGEPKIAEQIGTLTPEVLNEFARRHGIIGAGVGHLQDVARPEGIKAVENILQDIPVGRESWLDKIPGLNTYMGAMEHASGSLEDASKMTVFMDYVRRNPDNLKDPQRLLEDAALHTKRYLFDYCVDVETEILTNSGWKTIYTLQLNDKALTLDPETNIISFEPIKWVHMFPFDGELNRLVNGRFDALVTDNHRWLTQAGFATTNELRNKSILRTGGGDYCAPTEPAWEDEFVELLGWVVTEGSYLTHGNGVVVAQSEKHNPQYVERIRKLAKFYAETGATTNEYTRDVGWGNIKTFYFGKGIGKRIRTVAPNKQLTPQFLTSLTKQQAELLYETLVSADGHRKDNFELFTQKDRGRLDAFQMLCGMLGKRTACDDKECPTVSVYTSLNTYVSSLTITRTSYNDLVWCPVTPTGTWFARRNGYTYWTGNSEVTPREQALRSTLVPFLTFAKKSLPLQVEAAVTKPQMISGLAHFQRGGENAVPEAERIPEQFVPEWLKAYGGTQIPWNKLHEALPQVFSEAQGATFINPYLPIGDLDPLLAPERLFEELGGRLGPVPKALAEAAWNRNLLYGGNSTIHPPSTRYTDPSFVPRAMQPFTRLLGYKKDVAPTPLWHLPQTFVPAVATAGRLFPEEGSPQQRWLNFMLGAGLENQTPEKLAGTARRLVNEKRRRDATLRRLNTLK